MEKKLEWKKTSERKRKEKKVKVEVSFSDKTFNEMLSIDSIITTGEDLIIEI